MLSVDMNDPKTFKKIGGPRATFWKRADYIVVIDEFYGISQPKQNA